MKPQLIITTIIAAGLAFSGCDKKPAPDSVGSGGPSSGAPVSEADALAKFKTEVEAVVKWNEETQKTTPKDDPAAGMAMMSEMVSKFAAVPTNGLPADLKGAWGDFNGVLGELDKVVKGMPKVDKSKPDEAMKAMFEMLPKMMELQTKVEPIVKTLSEVGKKYGIDNLEKVGPDKGGGEAPDAPPIPPAPPQ